MDDFLSSSKKVIRKYKRQKYFKRQYKMVLWDTETTISYIY